MYRYFLIIFQAFNTKKKLQRHIDSTHKERDPALQCPQCPFIGLCASSLRNHIKWHTTERNFQCDQCPKMYKSQSCLNYHIRSSHRKELPYKCNICGKFFPAGCQLKAHEVSHAF
jgi:KRAB domain-containing zinc finger protein